jgi:hydroxymethylglutaryl-CoA synthase
MNSNAVGISDLALYVPSLRIDLDTLLQYRVQEAPELERRLRRAVDSTGQQSIRFPHVWEDNVTLSAMATHKLLANYNEEKLNGLRYLAVGTETAVDHSKPISAYVEGMLQGAGVPVPGHISTFQVQHACAGGTISLLSVGALLQASARPYESGVVICSDIARYDAPSTAEITQGAGAVSMLVEPDPALVELDISTQGYASRDVDDFFRPLGSTTAKVKGGYSVQCYNEALEAAFSDHCSRLDEDPAHVLQDTDLFVLHVPFYKMAVTALHKLIAKHTDMSSSEIDEFLHERGFQQSIDPARKIGNIYSGSAYMALIFLLQERYQQFGADIVGKRLLLASYGSGNTMTVVGGRVAEGAPDVISNWDIDKVWANRTSSMEEYTRWLDAPYDRDAYASILNESEIPEGNYYLSDIREDGYREYRFK